MKPPILRVRKGAQVYDDGGPETLPPAAGRKAPDEPPRRRSRILGRVLLLPVVVLGFAIIAFLKFTPRQPPDHASIAGAVVVLRATVYGDLVLVSLTFTEDAKGSVRGSGSAVRVHLEIPETGAVQELDGSLVALPEIIRGQLAYSAAARQVLALIEAGEKRVTLSAALH